MEFDSGLKGPVQTNKDDWDINYKTLSQQLKMKKVIIEDVIQERINPLVPLDGVIEEDIEILQYLGDQKLKESSGVRKDLKQSDKSTFLKARKDLQLKSKDLLIKIIPKKRESRKSLKSLKKILKIKKSSQL
jgi:hypothetical protein